MIATPLLALVLLPSGGAPAPPPSAESPGKGASVCDASQRPALDTQRVRHRLAIWRAALPALSTSGVCGVTRFSAVGGGTVESDGGAAVTSRGVCWSTGSTPTVEDSRTVDGSGGGSFTSSITGLSANTTYCLRAYATNAVGTGYGDPVTFATADGYAGQAPPGLTPELFAPGLVSTAGNQSSLVVHPGGGEIDFLVVESRGGTVGCSIHMTRLAGCTWTTPAAAPFSGTYTDAYPAIHPDGSRLYFQSDRPIDRSESVYQYNIWYVERQGDGWSEPRSVGRPINGRNTTSGPSVTRDGTMYFTIMDERTGHAEIFRSRLADGAYQEPERLPDQVNSRFQTCDSYVAPDESYLLFVAFPGTGHTNNPGGLYVSFRGEDGSWSEARDIRPTIGSNEGSNVTISPDGRFLFLTRSDATGTNGLDVYWVDAAIVRAGLAPAR